MRRSESEGRGDKTNLDGLLVLLWDFQSKFSDNVPAHIEKQTIVSILARMPPALPSRRIVFALA